MDASQQKQLFDIPEDICYLNTASLSPSFKAVETAGIQAVLQKSRPYLMPSSDFFEPVIELKKRFAKIIETDEFERITTIPSVSYGIATVVKNIKLNPGDTVVFSSSPIPGNQQSVSAVVNQLTRRGANVLTNSPLNSLHTTGHASKEEQALMLQLIKPKYFMPIHGEYKMLKAHRQTGIETGVAPENIFICANGDVVAIRDGVVFNPEIRFQADDIYVDGKDSSGLSTAVLKDRKILADSGMVSVIVTIDSRTNKILCKPNIVSRGFVFIKENQTLLKEAEMIVYEALKKRMERKVTFGDIKNTIRGSLEPFLYKNTQRNPLVIPVILNQKEANKKPTKS